MKKKVFFLAALGAIALTSCTDDTFLGETTPTVVEENANDGAILFGMKTQGTTRADSYGYEAANKLYNEFVVAGFKGTITGVEEHSMQTVFDHYTVDWTVNTAGTTTSNTSDWEYVGKTLSPLNSLPAGATQTIKYWDYSVPQYDFVAFSVHDATLALETGSAPSVGTVQVSKVQSMVAPTPPATDYTYTPQYTIRGNKADLLDCYISDMVSAYKEDGDYTNEVSLKFRNLACQVRVALYETVPGYSVSDVKFYTSNSAPAFGSASATSATLFTTGSASKDYFQTAGMYTVTFPTRGHGNKLNVDYNKAHIAFTADASGLTTQAFGDLNYSGRESKEIEGNHYLARTSNAPTFAGIVGDKYYTKVLPNDQGTVLELRVDYTLVSTDGSGETIKVNGATAYVPATYTMWKPNYAYTYIFKISENTNGYTDVEQTKDGLFPITFDAVVLDPIDTDNEQTTITTVAMPSITTYQYGHVYDESNEYKAGNIYVQVFDGSNLKNDLNTNATVYTLSTISGSTPWTEANVMDALNIFSSSSSTQVDGRNGIRLTKVTSGVSHEITTIVGEDGNNKDVTKFTTTLIAATSGTYAYVYKVSDGGVGEDIVSSISITSDPGGDWASTYTNYWKDMSCTIQAPVSWESGTYYYKQHDEKDVYAVKIIIVE